MVNAVSPEPIMTSGYSGCEGLLELGIGVTMMSFDAEFLPRLQFSWVIAWHILLCAFTVGVASYITLLEGLHLFTGNAIPLKKAV